MESESIALSSSSCAPTEFQVLSSYDSRTTTISVAVEHCQLCLGSRRSFYCRDCIRAGDFQHSSGAGGDRSNGNNACWGPSESNRLQSYAEKFEKLKVAQEERLQFFERYLELSAKHNRCTQKITDVRLRKERNALLKMAVHNTEKQVTKGVADLKRLCRANNAVSKTISSIKNKMKAMSAQFKLYQKQIEPLSHELERTKNEMVSEQRCHIANLTKYIFPIETVQQKGDSDSLMKTRVSLLAEARHTAYIKGRWIKGLSEWEEMYRIVKAVLPGNGDYALYCTSFWDTSVLERRDSLPQTDQTDAELTRRNESWNMTAGLCFAAQLVHNIAIFLRTHLPWNLHFREFCWAELSEKQFSAAVFKLNCNILHLCYTQNVNLEGLHPQHTICNIRTLLDHADLGRFIMSNDLELLSAIEDSLMSCSEELDLSDSMERLDIVDREWEHVPVTLPEAEMPTQAAITSYFSAPPSTQPRSSQESQSTMTSLASGLVSSAMASIWRGWGKSDK